MQHYQKYNELHQKYTEIYGDKTIIFQHIGSFFEAYCHDANNKENLIEIINLLQIVPVIKNTNSTSILTCGFTVNSLEKVINILTDNDYTIIIFDNKDTDDQIQIYSNKTLCSMVSVQLYNYIKYFASYNPFYYCFYLK